MSAKHALYPGTFDPVTLGHLDVLKRALGLFGRVTVAVATDGKVGFLPVERRVDLYAGAVEGLTGCRVVPFSGLLVDEVKRQGADVVVRGIRSLVDYDHEWSMVQVNRALLLEVEYVFLMARPDLAGISSSLVREVARLGGDLKGLVPTSVAAALLPDR